MQFRGITTDRRFPDAHFLIGGVPCAVMSLDLIKWIEYLMESVSNLRRPCLEMPAL